MAGISRGFVQCNCDKQCFFCVCVFLKFIVASRESLLTALLHRVVVPYGRQLFKVWNFCSVRRSAVVVVVVVVVAVVVVVVVVVAVVVVVVVVVVVR